MAAPMATCPVCGETTPAGPPGASAPISCPRCGSTFGEHEATVVAASAHAPSGAATPILGEQERLAASAKERLPEIPGYEVLSFVARGGMGMVLKARHLVLDRLAAIKMPLPNVLAHAESRVRFLREARAAAHLRHPNICPIYEVSDSEARPFIAMAFIEGQSLRDWAKAKPPSPRQAAEMAALLARAVGHAHEHGVIHRDIKPANVMVDSETGQPVLTDFGLAKELRDQGPQVTSVGAMVGTPAYMAPEQAAGQAEQIGPRTDIYALGAVLYELLCGRPPFLGSISQILYQLGNEEPVPPRRLNARVHRDLETICLKAMAKDPAARYETATALAEDLERFSAGEPIQARRTGIAGRLARRVRRNPVSSAVILALVVAVAAVGYLALRAGTTRRVAALRESLEAGLDAAEWPQGHIEAMEGLVAELERLAPAQGAGARQRLHQRFAGAILESLRRPALAPGDIARLDAEIALLGGRAPGLAPGLRRSLDERLRAWQPHFDLRAPFDGLARVFDAGQVRVEGGKALAHVLEAKDGPPAVLARLPCEGNVQLEAVFSPAWETAQELGLALNASSGRKGYWFLLRVAAPPATEPGKGAGPARPASFAASREGGGEAEIQLLRGSTLLRRTRVPVGQLGRGPLHLLAGREGSRLTFQVGGLAPVVFQDVFPISGAEAGAFGVRWPSGVPIERLWASRQALSVAPSPLEQGDELYGKAQMAEALGFYRQQAIAAVDARFRQEARFKEALCLEAQKRGDEAAAAFERLAAEKEGEWPVLAACQLWLMRLRQERFADADAIFDNLSSRYRFEQLAVLVPEHVRDRVLFLYSESAFRFSALQHDPSRIRHLERQNAVVDLLDPQSPARVWPRLALVSAYDAAGEVEKARAAVEKFLGEERACWNVELCEKQSWLLRLAGEAPRALTELNRRLLDGQGKPSRQGCHLLVERARVQAALGRWADAESDIESYLQIAPPEKTDLFYYRNYAGACLIQGFLRERRGDAAGAQEAWRRGFLKPESRAGARVSFASHATSGVGIACFSILGSLCREITEADVEALVAAEAGRALNDSTAAILRGFRLPPSVYAAACQMWLTPRGREYARKFAFLDISFAEFLGTPLPLLFYTLVRQDALGGEMSPEQDALVWQASQGFFAAYTSGKLGAVQLAQGTAAWKGITNFLGWGGMAPSLDPAIRGPLAYVLGHRYLRLKRPEDAASFFRTALADAPPDSSLHRLAQAELDHLKTK